jgi:hypothetical protein
VYLNPTCPIWVDLYEQDFPNEEMDYEGAEMLFTDAVASDGDKQVLFGYVTEHEMKHSWFSAAEVPKSLAELNKRFDI